ncbi:MAG: NeuD/PglB/VioB family sugar acetyltransferase [Deltaproteobacteria bacterium]|jgi:sugar O-acyltransferase (sialic acid O-acetyltransferase NeuD family)|nr:NeuD/PglB/VioB family sugar acetyltransferase [Deltaproteobacteria bacterium]
MNKPEIILVGAGGHAHACIDVIEQHAEYRIVGLVGRPNEVGEKHLGYDVIASDDDLPALVDRYRNAIITVGQIKSPDIRIRLYQHVKNYGFNIPVIVSPRAYVSRHATVGEGSIVMHDALVNAGARIGVNCIVNTKALVEHDAIVEDHCHVSTGSIVNGGASVKEKTFIGSNAMIGHAIEIEKSSIVHGGEAVTRSLPSKTNR